jgi:uncharacterized membrane protein YqaE (UPF0057 family)
MAVVRPTGDTLNGDLMRAIVSVLFPPIGVYMETGFSRHLLLNFILTAFGFIPGVIHAFYIIRTR